MWLQALKEQARLDDLTTVLNFNHHSQHGLQKMTRKNVNHRYLWNSTDNKYTWFYQVISTINNFSTDGDCYQFSK
jgi:hypothetical protein